MKCITFLLTSLFVIFSLISIAQDWGSENILSPSFAGDNRFNHPLDLSGIQNTTPYVPNWTQDLILYQMRIDKFGTQPTINSAREKLWILERLGVTGVVLNPIAQPFKWPNGNFEEWNYYSHLEPAKLDPDLGTEEDFTAFVNQLHDMGIKVFLDFEFHGVFDRNVFLQGKYPVNQDAFSAAGPQNVSSLISEHPEFFEKISDEKGTHIRYTDWNTAELMWRYSNGTMNTRLMNWYKKTLKNDWIIKYNLDGLRLDLEPYEVANEVGYSYWESLIAEVKNETGKTILLIPEDGNAQRNNAFCFAQEDFGVENPRFGLENSAVKDFMVSEVLYNYPRDRTDVNNHVFPVNIVDEVKDTDGDLISRNETYYTSCISSHDRQNYPSKGHLVYFGYGMLFQPFIPLWFMGNEFNVRKNVPADPFFDKIYFNRITWSDYDTNQKHFNEVRKMIYIRKKYKNLIGPSTHMLNKKPMLKIGVIGTQPDLPPFAYYNQNGDSIAILVLGTKEKTVKDIVVELSLENMRLANHSSYEFHNLLTDEKKILFPIDDTSNRFRLETLEAWENLIYKVEPCKDLTAISEKEKGRCLIYPNPANAFLKLRIDGSTKFNELQTIEILNFTGGTVKSLVFSNDKKFLSGSSEIKVDISDLNSGGYFIRIKTNSGNTIKKFMKL